MPTAAPSGRPRPARSVHDHARTVIGLVADGVWSVDDAVAAVADDHRHDHRLIVAHLAAWEARNLASRAATGRACGAFDPDGVCARAARVAELAAALILDVLGRPAR